MDLLQNYYTLRQRVDELCRGIEEACRDDLVCAAGCDGCCRHLSLFQVEGYALAVALARLPEDRREAVRARARAALADGPCPLLEGGLCALYEDRPLICRTHGLPLLVSREEGRIDFCPENFRSKTALPPGSLIDLERLNTALAAVETLYLCQAAEAAPRGRITIAQSLLQSVDPL